MRRTAHFLGPAEAEMLAAARCYESKCEGLGHRFLDEVNAVVASIINHPGAGTKMVGDVRRRLVRHFPFSLLYIIEADTIQVLAVMDTRQHPDYWRNREEL